MSEECCVLICVGRDPASQKFPTWKIVLGSWKRSFSIFFHVFLSFLLTSYTVMMRARHSIGCYSSPVMSQCNSISKSGGYRTDCGEKMNIVS
jgi:hypothetical protein